MDKGWSIDSSDWESVTQVLPQSKTWNSVLLTSSEQSTVPDRSGVYAICAPPPNVFSLQGHAIFQTLATPIYIGRSESNIRSRFLNHCDHPSPQLQKAKQCYRKVQLTFWFIELPTNEVKDAEAWMIKCFGPPANIRAGTIRGYIKPPIEP